MKKIVFAAMYSDCYHESALGVISIHETMSGALDAIGKHKEKMKCEYEDLSPCGDEEIDEIRSEWVNSHPWTDGNGSGHELWEICSFEVNP